MKHVLPVLLYAAVALAGFGPNVRIDHDDKPTNRMLSPAITLGPRTSSGQPLYVAFEDDSTDGIVVIRADIMFQKSTDAGRTWLPADVLVHRGSPSATYPDITTDPDGDIYIVYRNADSTGSHSHCVRSSDGGNTMSSWARITADSGGNLFESWTDGHVYSSVSTDKGVTWSPRQRVDDDTVSDDCWDADAYVQPGTNHYLVVATAPYHSGDMIVHGSYFYRSTDMGRTFQPGVRLDTFGGVTCQPHVVADAQHVICDYTGSSHNSEQINTEARTLYTQPDTWDSPAPVTELDTPRWSYYNGAKLAISADGRVHTALMIHEPFNDNSLTFYSSSFDHGVTWSELELVNDDSTADSWDQDIAADSAGHAYIVWQNNPGERGEVWFSTNNPAGIAEEPTEPAIIAQPSATVVRNFLLLPEASSPRPQAPSSLLDISGRGVMDLRTGANDVSRLSPGVYFLREAQAQAQAQAVGVRTSAVTKVVVTR
jgi:hypothetical protein